MGQIVLPKTGLSVVTCLNLYSSHESETAPHILSWLTEIIVRKTVSTVSSSTQMCIDNFPRPLLWNTPLDYGLVDRKTGNPLSPNWIIISSATLSQSFWGLLSWTENHFLFDPGPRNDHLPDENLFAQIETSLALNSHFSLSLDHHEMSLNIDMKIIRPVKFSGCTLNLDRNSWILLQSCNVVNPWKILHSNSIDSPSIVSKALYCDELLNHVNLSSPW